MRKTSLRKINIGYYKLAFKTIEKYHPVYHPQDQTGTDHLISSPQVKSLLSYYPSIVCIIDITKKEYLYVSHNIQEMLGYTPEEFYEEGFLKTVSLFPEEHIEIIVNKLFPVMFKTLDDYSLVSNCENLKISYTSLFNKKDGTQRWYLHQITVLRKNEEGKAQLLLKQVTDIHEHKDDQSIAICISCKDSDGFYREIYKKTFVPSIIHKKITRRETEILQMVGQGFSSREIGALLQISQATVINHRKNILRKFNVTRTGDLIRKASGYGLI